MQTHTLSRKECRNLKFFFDLFRKALNGARWAANQPVKGRRPTRCAPFCIEEYRLGHRGTLIHRPISVANRANKPIKGWSGRINPQLAQKTSLKTQLAL